MARVCLAIRMASRAQSYVWWIAAAALPFPGSWLSAVVADLGWFVSVDPKIGPRAAGVEAVWEWLRSADKGAIRLLHQAAQQSSANTALWAVSRAQREMAETFECDACSAAFSSRQGLAVHKYKVHAKQRAARQYLDTDFCPACLLCFSARERVVAHMHEKSPKCLEYLLRTFPQLPAETVVRLDSLERDRLRPHRRSGRRRVWASTPVFRLIGPLSNSGISSVGRRHHAF